MAFSFQNPNIYLSCNLITPQTQACSYQTSHHIWHHIMVKVEHRHGSKQTNIYHIQNRNIGMLRSNKHMIISNTFMFIKARLKSNLQTNACSYKGMPYHTYLTAPQHLCINAWLYHMHVHGKSNKEKKRNPNLTCEGQTTNK